MYKEPLEEELDPEPFTMEGLRKAKSSSTMSKSDIEIFDVTDLEIDCSLAYDEKVNTPQLVTESDDHSINKNIGSVTIEECETGESSRQKPERVMGTAESWDNISQYLDKEERGPDQEDKETSTSNDQHPSKDTQESERKRKLSAESSYSRLSQTKSALLKKLAETKKKFKMPKLTFTASKVKKTTPKKTKGSPTEIKKETTKKLSKDLTNKKEVKPVYIHIPLNAPADQKDEFTHFENGEESKIDNGTKKGGAIFKKMGKPKRTSGFKNLVKQVQESKLEAVSERENIAPVENIDSTLQVENNAQSKCEEEKQQCEVDKTNNDEENISETVFSVKTKPPSFTIGTEEIRAIRASEEETIESESIEQKHDGFEHLFDIAASKKLEEEHESRPEMQVRSKSVEPERKRKYSLESSYSRKSLSKLGIMKKLKQASDKLKSKFSGSKQTVEKKDEDEPVKVKKTSKKLEPLKAKDPVYIHIPLKPLEGETDEFSHFASGDNLQSIDSEISNTPDSPKSGVQFIMLTAPSDDEILDYNSSDVPETPSSENKMFFANKVIELKELAKEVVDEVAVSRKNSKLASVEEDTNGETLLDHSPGPASDSHTEPNQNEKSVVADEIEIPETSGEKVNLKVPEEKNLTIDEEDGLSETTTVKPKAELVIDNENIQEDSEDKTELKSSMKGTESPVIRKKVSFKRRSKNSREDSYEEIHTPEASTKTAAPQIVAFQKKDQIIEKDKEVEPHVTFAEGQKEWSDIM